MGTEHIRIYSTLIDGVRNLRYKSTLVVYLYRAHDQLEREIEDAGEPWPYVYAKIQRQLRLDVSEM